jgi:uncharacterized protein YpbB
MTSSKKQFAILEALRSAEPYMVPDASLFGDANIWSSIPLSYTEFRKLLTELEEKRRVVCIDNEDGKKWKITDAGRARLAELA